MPVAKTDLDLGYCYRAECRRHQPESVRRIHPALPPLPIRPRLLPAGAQETQSRKETRSGQTPFQIETGWPWNQNHPGLAP